MSETGKAKGHCLCGEVEIKASSMSKGFGACHCGMCRKWSGGPLLAVNCNTDVEISGAENITVYDSSGWAERSFCSRCGTHLYYKIKKTGQYIIPVGLFDNASTLQFDHQIFIEQKPDYYAFANPTHNMTGDEVIAQFVGEQPPNN
jgi:hypothetical protein